MHRHHLNRAVERVASVRELCLGIPVECGSIGQPGVMKVFLTLTCAGMLLAGLGFGTLIEGTDEPVRQTVLFAMGIWLTLVGIVRFGKEP
jgi:hypothetical protein